MTRRINFLNERIIHGTGFSNWQSKDYKLLKNMFQIKNPSQRPKPEDYTFWFKTIVQTKL